ncbi:MAG: hypothetical protein JWM43_3098 [Acidobacteriaceae bacterium]|nr:hypothetical protein [Acidobacteriaceae bacterium]
MLVEEKVASQEEVQAQVERILRSDGFRSSEVLRKLLAYLAEKAAGGEADQLKEYVVAIEGLGKPSSYDPQQNSTVRIQVGRLRQKLAEYYRTEGLRDPLLIDLPKGRFRLTCEHRMVSESATALVTPAIFESVITPPLMQPSERTWRGFLPGLGAGLILALLCLLGFLLYNAHRKGTDRASQWPPEMGELWLPFTNASRPLILSIEDPLFVEISSNPGIYYRDRSLNEWNDAKGSLAIKRLSESLSSANVQPSRYYTAFGEAEAAFHLGRLLGSRTQNISIMRTSQLSWHQIADNNIVFVGVQNLFFEQLQGMPVASELVANLEGIRNTHPAAGEPAFYKDEYVTAPREQGIIYALTTHITGPMGDNDVLSFTSIRSPGYVGAVRFFTNPDTARTVVTQLKQANGGRMPRVYQVLLRIRFKDNVPTETTYVLSRILH